MNYITQMDLMDLGHLETPNRLLFFFFFISKPVSCWEGLGLQEYTCTLAILQQYLY